MARRSKAEALETRETILDAAIEVFHQHGVARPSLTEVARLAGVTRGAVYGHFRNKADLFNALCDRIRLPAETLCEGLDRLYEEDPLALLRERWAFVFRTLNDNHQWRQIMEIVFHRCELVTESGEIRERILLSRGEGDEHIARLLNRAVELGQLPQQLNVAIAAPLLHSSLIGILEDWVLQPREYSLAEVGPDYLEALLDMLRLSPSLQRRPAPSV